MNANDVFVPYQLMHSSPDAVFAWLRENASRKTDWLDRDELEAFEKSLLERKDNLINLGLALYGRAPEVALYLFRNSDNTIKKACCCGKSVAPDLLCDSWVEQTEVIPVLLKDWNTNLLAELVRNSGLPDGLLVKLYRKQPPFDQLDEEKWTLLMAWSSRNERISKPYESDWIDGYDEYLYNEVFYAGWEAFGKVTVTRRNANAMSSLGQRLVPRAPVKTNIMEIIERWRSDDKEDDERFGNVRIALTKILERAEFNKLKDSSDLALRKGYYSYHDYRSADELMEDFARDGKDFLDYGISNESIFRNPEVRSAFRKCSWDVPDEHSRLDYPNYYKSREKYWRSKNPDWFKDICDGDYPFEDIKDFETRIDRRLAAMNSQINDLSRIIIGDGGMGQHLEEEQVGLKETLYSETKSIAEILVKIYRQNTAVWGWGIAGLAAGFIVAKFF